MKKKLLLILNLITVLSRGQTGTFENPFTELGQALGVSDAGTYYFNLNGTTFDTYVDADGYVQIAIDFGNGAGNLPAGTSLSTSTRGIMNATVLASLTSATEVRITSSDGTVDVLSTNSTIISRVQNNIPIHKGTADNTINDSWTGTNSSYLTGNASCTNSSEYLNQNIIHPCGNGSTFHWVPSSNAQRIVWNNGEIADAASFRLWVRDASSLPVKLSYFNVVLTNTKKVQVSWETSTEINNNYFTIERSKDGKKWEEVKKIKGAGNSSQLISYSTFDNNPLPGISYYRLKQTDNDGNFTYSKVNVIMPDQHTQVVLYPNPTSSQITIKGIKAEIDAIKIYNLLGEDVSRFTHILIKNDLEITIDLSELEPGVYLVKTLNVTNKVYVQ